MGIPSGKIALVTGASRGIGAAIAVELARAGVVVAGALDAPGAPAEGERLATWKVVPLDVVERGRTDLLEGGLVEIDVGNRVRRPLENPQ
jgi:NAD(P)-dependent dehydrogenase (short-subunit alcohol dehydrogenase family)